MNKLKLFPIALTALVLGACSSEDIIDNGGQGPVAQGEKGYVSFAINLPTTPSTRANDVFDDGAAYEYNVNDATLLIFNGDSEDDAKFYGAYNLTLGNAELEGGVDDNITTTHKAIASFVKPSGNVYALVIVNKGDVLTGSEKDGWKLNDANLTSGTTSFNDFRTVAQTLDVSRLASTTGKGNFFMTNAPLYTQPGNSTDPTINGTGKAVTLTEIPSASIYPTQSEAESKPATSIYVERAVAKVTVKAGKESGNVSVGTGKIPYELSGWTLDITNKKSYIVRNVKDASWWGYKSSYCTKNDVAYRFVGSANVSANLYRTYWAYDPNYSSYEDEFNMLQGTTPTSLTKVGGNAYCLENTFDVDNQNQNQTTRVIVAATLKGGEDFCILNNDKTTLYKKEDVIKAIKEEYLKNSTVVAALKNPDTGLIKDDNNYSIGENQLTVTFSNGMTEYDFLNGGNTDLGGDLTVAEIKINSDCASWFKKNAIPTVLTPGGEGNADIIAAVNNGKKVSYYKDGVAYYPVMIRHFDEDQTPWTAEGKTESYPEPNAEANWLGRYGVLRNNWYEINVTGIKSIGSADVPDVDGTPDDPLESWISVEINVLSWAKRTQNVEL